MRQRVGRPRCRHPRREVREGGFTLVELLVVMGIIVLLMSILIPVASRVRRSARETETRAELSRIATAVQAYYNDFQALPGPIAENDIDGTGGGTAGTPAAIAMQSLKDTNGTAVINVTSSQNLVLGLLGGTFLTFNNGTVSGWTYDPTAVGNGPQSLNTSLSAQKRVNAYLNVPPGELPPRDGSNNFIAFGADAYTGTLGLPTFQDHLPGNIVGPGPTSSPGQPTANAASYQFGPILYFRARVGRQGIISTLGPANTQQYDLSVNTAYGFTSATSADYPVGTLPYPDSTTVYFANPAVQGQPRSKDSFILISAGADRIYGTKDDIIYSN